ncbi:alpha/beta-hydrolase [Guyanagaster necrorhizus]|uniref:Alpha/beta-hydrolase n=1 Tax=Guyanagaster necrorhizus TaxID=856835 RepID=A0A9P7VLZ8_9AGAR|nr:alpha/beta-hydrolase [Guyanagaster necrorhizus MCA 3950]KAG7442917.1 alpha/beta-hydrolase [Guyanagaster necrorhizus MCA 3950]
MPRLESWSIIQPNLSHPESYKYPPLIPLDAPPIPTVLPQLPSQQRSPAWLPDGWTHTTHIIPAAYPRSSPDAVLPELAFDANSSKSDRQKLTAERLEQLLALREKENGHTTRNDKLLWLCFNRYARKNTDGKGLTLFFAHANGFCKEIWETTISSFLSSRSERYLSEMWVWDAVNQGDSALLNQGKLNSMCHWHDPTRDILNFLLHHIPSKPSLSLPTHLSRVTSAESTLRKSQGFSDRKVVMVGHSFGGAVSTLAALDCPVLFNSLFLVDPVIIKPGSPRSYDLMRGALTRRDRWKNREEAISQLLSSPFFQRWDPDVVKSYVNFGMYETEDGQVTLKTPSLQEAIMFVDTCTGCYEAWVRLYRGELDERIEVRWVVPGFGEIELGMPGATQERVSLRKDASNVLIDGAGHLIAQERPKELAMELSLFLERKYGMVQANL